MAVARSSLATNWSTSTSLFSKYSTMLSQLAAGGAVAELVHRSLGLAVGPAWIGTTLVAHRFPPERSAASTSSTDERARPSANRVTRRSPATTSAEDRITAPSGRIVMV